MSMFNFDATANASQGKVFSQLAGNKIHDIVFDGAVAEDLESKKTGETYKVIKLKFKNDSGTFEHTVFEPIKSKGDFDRVSKEYTKDGKTLTFPTPSRVEDVMLLFKHCIDAFRPEVGKKIDNKEATLGANNWDELRTNVSTVLNKGIGVESSIKLISDSKGYARFPGFFSTINEEGVAIIRNNFIGKNLGFTPYEKQRIESAANTAAKTSNFKELDFPQDSGSELPDDLANFSIANL